MWIGGPAGPQVNVSVSVACNPNAVDARQPLSPIKSDDDRVAKVVAAEQSTPDAVQPTRWQNTSEGVSLFALWGRPGDGDGPENGLWGHAFSSCFFVWGPDNKTEWRAMEPGAILSEYVPFSRDPGCERNLSWWQRHHQTRAVLY